MNRAIVRTLGCPGILCASLVMLSPAAGEEYSWQLAGSYRQDDAPRVVESGRSSLGATYYLSPVDDEAGPYELASFLNRSSFVTVNLARSKLREELVPAIVNVDPSTGGMLPPDVLGRFGDTGFPGLADIPVEIGIDTSEYAVSGRYVWPGSGWYAGAGAERGAIDHVPQVHFTEIEAQQEGSQIICGQILRVANSGRTGIPEHDATPDDPDAADSLVGRPVRAGPNRNADRCGRRYRGR